MIYALERASGEERKAIETVISDATYEQVPFMRMRSDSRTSPGDLTRLRPRPYVYGEIARDYRDVL